FSSRRRHTRSTRDWSSDVCSSDLEELGTGPASIYWHVRNKGELLQLLYERVMEEVRLPAPDPSRWTEQLRELARQVRDIMRRHQIGRASCRERGEAEGGAGR